MTAAVAPAGLRLDRFVLGQLERAAHRPVIGMPGQPPRSGAELIRVVGAQVEALLAAGVTSGSVIAVVSDPRPEALAAWLAASAVGGSVAPLPHVAPAFELDRLLGLLRPAAVLTDEAARTKLDGLDLPVPALRIDPTGPGDPSLVPGPSWPLNRELDVCVIRPSSGTTSAHPRLLALSHRSVVLTLLGEMLEARASPASRLLVGMPLEGAGGWFALAFLAAGGFVQICAHPSTLAAGEVAGFSHLLTVPAVLRRLAGSWPRDEPAPAAITTGSLLDPATRQRWEAARGTITDVYGATETELVTTARPGEGGIGFPFFGAEVTPAAAGERGPIRKRGPDVYSGLWRPGTGAPARAAADADPTWVETGDLGQRGADGSYAALGRSDDVLVVGGNNVLPLEVEGVLEGHPSVDAAAVVAGEGADGPLTAYVVPGRPGLEEQALRDLVAGELAGYKCPRRYVFVDSLPRNDFGKVQRWRLSAAWAAEHSAPHRQGKDRP